MKRWNLSVSNLGSPLSRFCRESGTSGCGAIDAWTHYSKPQNQHDLNEAILGDNAFMACRDYH